MSTQTTWLRYCCFYDPRGPERRFQGQKNLSAHVLTALERTYGDYLELLPYSQVDQAPNIASLLKVTREIETIRASSGATPKGITVVDMVLSLAYLPIERCADAIILIGHDSYALRAWREWQKTRFGLRWLRRGLAWWAWHRLERRLSRICEHRIYVSPVDLDAAGPSKTASFMPIPLHTQILAGQVYASTRQEKSSPKKILVPVPVLNTAQNSIEETILRKILVALPHDANVSVWGAAADHHAKALGADPRLHFVDWVTDYSAFLSSFDLLIYPRLVGSGFHTKLAEALALGVPCLAVDWICEALAAAGYTGLTAFREETFSATLDHVLQAGATPPKGLPDAAKPDVAMAPLIAAINATRDRLGDAKDKVRI